MESTIGNYSMVINNCRLGSRKQSGCRRKPTQTKWLVSLEYGNFLLENFTYLMNTIGVEYQAQPMDIILPMGISFYTFQTMSYTLDVYNRKAKPANTFLDFALYVTFFPQLVAGPIVRAGELIEQFYTEKKATFKKWFWLIPYCLIPQILFSVVKKLLIFGMHGQEHSPSPDKYFLTLQDIPPVRLESL